MTEDRRQEYLDTWGLVDQPPETAATNGQPEDGWQPSDQEPPHDDDQPAPAETETERKPAFRHRLLSVSDLARLPVVQPLVGGLLYRDTLAQLSGPPGSYKSFISIGVSCALAAGENSWEGHRIPAREHVVYVVAEGASGLYARILAWCEHNCVDPQRLDGWLHILPVAMQLGIRAHVDEAVEMVNDVGAGLLVLDTRARCTVGLEENSATEQGQAVEAADRIRAATDCCTVWTIHHTGRNGLHPRGSTAWDGAVWSDLRLTRDDATATVTVEKHKDAPSGRTYEYRMRPHTVSQELMPGVPEEARNTLVGFSFGDENLGKILTQNENRVREIAENSCGLEGLSRTRLVELAEKAGMASATAYRAFNALVERGVLSNVGTEKQRRYVRSGLVLGGDDDQ